MNSFQQLFDICDRETSFHLSDDKEAFEVLFAAVQADPSIASLFATETYNKETLLAICLRTVKVDTSMFILNCSQESAKVKDSQGFYPLHQAICTGSLELVEVLCELCPKAINAETVHDKVTPLLFAVMDDSAELTKLLLTKGAAVTDKVWKYCKPTSYDTAEMKVIRTLVATLG